MDRNAAKAELDAAIAEARRVFDLPRPATTGVCKGCCMDPEIEADFLNHGARDLPDAYLRDWFFAAFADDLGYAQMGWLMPRIMESLADGKELPIAGEEVTLSRLPVAGFPERWPADAVAAVERFCFAFLEYRLASGTSVLENILCMFSLGGMPVGPFLERLDALTDGELASLLHASWIAPYPKPYISLSAFWESPDRELWWAWQTSDALLDRMTRAGIEGDERAAAMSDAIHCIHPR